MEYEVDQSQVEKRVVDALTPDANVRVLVHVHNVQDQHMLVLDRTPYDALYSTFYHLSSIMRSCARGDWYTITTYSSKDEVEPVSTTCKTPVEVVACILGAVLSHYTPEQVELELESLE